MGSTIPCQINVEVLMRWCKYAASILQNSSSRKCVSPPSTRQDTTQTTSIHIRETALFVWSQCECNPGGGKGGLAINIFFLQLGQKLVGKSTIIGGGRSGVLNLGNICWLQRSDKTDLFIWMLLHKPYSPQSTNPQNWRIIPSLTGRPLP
jgi:hypothetical protein